MANGSESATKKEKHNIYTVYTHASKKNNNDDEEKKKRRIYAWRKKKNAFINYSGGWEKEARANKHFTKHKNIYLFFFFRECRLHTARFGWIWWIQPTKSHFLLIYQPNWFAMNCDEFFRNYFRLKFNRLNDEWLRIDKTDLILLHVNSIPSTKISEYNKMTTD